MQNRELAKDYIVRCEKRIFAIETLFHHEAWADVVRESQEVVELALKALLRVCNIEPPRTHDVSGLLSDEIAHIPKELHKAIKRMQSISKALRRDRELAYYGSEDLTPSDFYEEQDAKKALEDTRWLVKTVRPFVT